MFNRLEAIEKRYEELSQQIAQEEISTNPARLQPLAQEHASLDEIVTKYRKYKKISQSVQETESMLDEGLDPEMARLAKEELVVLRQTRDEMIEDLKVSLLPKILIKTRML